jgi:hypothetical protein
MRKKCVVENENRVCERELGFVKDIFREARAKGRGRLERLIFWMDDRPIRRISAMVGYQTDNVVGGVGYP